MPHAAERPDTSAHQSSRSSLSSAGDLARWYRAADFFVVRSPAQPLLRLLEWSGTHGSQRKPGDSHEGGGHDWSARRAALTARLRAVFIQAPMRQALYFASPEVERLCQTSEKLPDNLVRTLTRYFMRAAGRETPFGLFAGVSLARMASEDCFELGPAHAQRAATTVAICYQDQLLTKLVAQEVVRDSLRHTLSTTLVRLDQRYRFTTHRPVAESSGAPDKECLTLDLAATPHVDRAVAFAASGATLEELARHITGGPIEYTDALQFARRLSQRGLLVPELLPGATGRSPLAKIVVELKVHPALEAAAAALGTVERELVGADEGNGLLAPARYRSAAATLGRLASPAEGRHPLQTVLAKPSPLLAMGAATTQLFLDAASLLLRTSPNRAQSALADFVARFKERYGTASIPLAEALDNEVGVDFVDARASHPLLKDLPAEKPSSSAKKFDEYDRVRQRILHRALSSGRMVYELDDETLAEFPGPHEHEHEHEAESFAVLARLAHGENGQLSVVLPTILPSAQGMMARFCDAEPQLVEVLRQHARSEQGLAGNALLADIAYLPNHQAANIVARPALREFEIPYLGKSGAPADKQLPLSDLYVQVRADRVLLYSARYRKRVKVRIANALNHANGTHPTVYRFLAALQAQDEASLACAWSWGVFDESEFLPRIVRENTVLSLARWQLSSRDLESITSVEGARAFSAMQQLRERLRLPRWLTHGVGDQRLPVDLDNELSVEELLQAARSKRVLTLEEMLPGPSQLVLHGDEGHYSGEFIVPFLRRLPAAEESLPTTALGNGTATKRQHPPGSAWLYAKVYAAPARMDAILMRIRTEVLVPLRGSRIEDWFYLPFADPHPHLRVRFKGQPSELQCTVLPTLQRALQSELASGGAWRVQLDTYDQEQERYGGPVGVGLAEQIFSADSEVCSQLVQLCHPNSDLRWQIALLGIDRLLADFGFDLGERLAIARTASEDYGKESSASLATWKVVGVKFREHRPRLTELLWLTQEGAQGTERAILQLFAQRSSQVRLLWRTIARERAAGTVQAAPVDLARSFAHMHAIRMLGVEARAHELVLFDFLRRLYESRLARTRGALLHPAATWEREHERANN